MSLHPFTNIKGYGLRAVDGELGKTKDLLFDDVSWEVRYLIAKTGQWLSKREVLVHAQSLGTPDRDTGLVPVALTRERIRNSPDIDTQKPVSRQMQEQLAAYYQWPGLQTYSYWPTGTFIPPPVPDMPDAIPKPEPPPEGPQLRSCREIIGYAIAATNGEIGDVKDLVVDTEGWKIALIVVDTGKWLPGRKVLLSPLDTSNISWSDRSLSVVLSREQIQEGPPYDPDAELNAEVVRRILRHYGRPT